ncbi:glycoside hydrolase family 16 protein [Carboxylicivirga sp. N1Y90]|uniref:glycoside hydrolase family 16 protein n=1 Tax=Carboxylicivirga fragile TaxID=3417571 RepID=UPI003D3590FA|nr:glycoside hydrolase family 16 protein [Marinilabiliaceae bacterium N1Y90]
MASFIQTIFGSKYPNTSKYEADIEKLSVDHKRFVDYESSSQFKRFQELDTTVNSGDFKKKVEKLKTEKFKDSKEHLRLKEYLSLKKSGDLKKYFKYYNAGIPERLIKIANSKNFNEYSDLKLFLDSPEFKEEKSKKGFKKTENYKKFKHFRSLRRNADIRFYNKQINSTNYKNYLNIKDSERLVSFTTLKQEVESDKFQAFKKELEDPKRFKKSEEYALLSEYAEIKKTPEFIWHSKTEKQNPFKEIDKWKLTFEDDFDSKSINNEKWISGYYWGKALMNDVYVLANEHQFFTEKNIQLRNSTASLLTKNEKIKGKVWNETLGFVPKEFNYSSALISTGQSFRQLYGKFEVKVKIDHASPLTHAFWMVGENIAPQIDIFRFSKNAKSYTAGCHSADKNHKTAHQISTVNGAKFDSDYYVYGLEWTKNSLKWTVNGVKVHEQTSNIPQEPMYLTLSSHLLEDVEKLNSAAIEIDWVRCYQEN